MLKYVAIAFVGLSLSAQAVELTQEDEQWIDDAKEFILSQDPEAQAELGQTELGQDGNPTEMQRWGRRTWTCFARNRRGQPFSGTSVNRNTAQRIALRRCGTRSCVVTRCR
jgi:hypothetical protein